MKKINLCFFILLVLFIQVILTDTIIYFTHLSYGIANIIASVCNVAIIILIIRKKWIKIETDFNKWDIIFLTLLLVIIAITIIFPDVFWDSYSYHIYLQENPFSDKIYDDFFPGRTLTTFVFPIADRIFNMFRQLLGFRLGTLPGYLLLIVMFYQCKKFLKHMLKEKVEEKYISIFSILPLLAYIILQQIGTYYIDNFSIVLLLEFVYIILYETEEIFKNKPRLYYLAFIVGIAVCIKVTNAVYIALPLVYVLIKNLKNIKEIKWYDYILLIITAIIPMLPYLIDALVQTGSPVFPYYNTIFKSEYFAEKNWLDNRYGPKNIIQFLLWPIYIAKHPEKAYEWGQTDMVCYMGYIVCILNIAYFAYMKLIKKQKIQDKMLAYNVILMYLYIVWAKFVIGYIRYAGVILVLSSLLIIKTLIEAMQNKKMIISILLSTIIMLSVSLGCYQYFYNGALYNYSLIQQGNLGVVAKIKRNIKKLYIDKKNEKYDIDGIWGVIYDDSAVPLFLNVDDKLVHLEYGFKTGETQKSQELYWDNVLNNDIYVPLYTFKLDGKLEYFDRYKFEITEITDVLTDVSFLEGDSIIYIVKVKYNENLEKNNKEIFETLKEKIAEIE